MNRAVALSSIVVGLLCGVAAGAVEVIAPTVTLPQVLGYDVGVVLTKILLVAAIALVLYGVYRLLVSVVMASVNKRRAHNSRNALRLIFGFVGTVAILAALTQQWVGLLLSLGVVGFAITFALQQPLLSLIAWVYITVKQPYGVGDRVRIGDAKGDVIEVDFLVTTLWEVSGDLVSSDQPSGRVVTVPNSVVLSADVTNYGGGGSPYVWNEIGIQVAFETDLEYARRLMREEADDLLGDEMERHIRTYRDALAETPVELEVNERPSVNITQGESWVELKLRYLTHPRRGQRVKNELYERVLARFNEHPDRVAFPVSRSR